MLTLNVLNVLWEYEYVEFRAISWKTDILVNYHFIKIRM